MKFTNRDGMLSYGSLLAGHKEEHPFGSERGDAVIEMYHVDGHLYCVDAYVEGEDRKVSKASGTEIVIGRQYVVGLNMARKTYKEVVRDCSKGIRYIEHAVSSGTYF